MEDNSFEINLRDQASYALELPKVLELVANRAVSPLAQHAIQVSPILESSQSINNALEFVAEYRYLLDAGEDAPVIYLQDLTTTFETLQIEGSVTTIPNLVELAKLARNARDLARFFRSKPEITPKIFEIANMLMGAPTFEKRLFQAIDPDTFEVLETASPELYRIRKEIDRARTSVRKKLEQVFKKYGDKGALQEQIISVRDGRQVLLVKEEARRKIQGIVHDRSSTGQTFFIEPVETVELNNRVRQLEVEERIEIERIIRGLCDDVREDLDQLWEDFDRIIWIDMVRAKGLFSRDFLCEKIQVTNSGKINLEFARHPLLLEKLPSLDDVKALNLKIGGSYNTLLISGPNSGGKTVAMKTVGLLILMTKLGLPVPASADSEIGTLGRLFVDIGDEQSIEDDLSTFTSHMARLRTMLKKARARDLVLIDEIGAGTDPDEGTALALSILQELTARGVLTITTTHMGALKEYAHNAPRVENGSMIFDLETLQPTYRFRRGVPGSSYAFEIAKRAGIDNQVIDRAREMVGSEKGRVESLIADLENRLNEQEELIRTNKLEKARLDGLVKLYKERSEEYKANKRKLKEEAIAEADRILKDANSTIEATIKAIREEQASQEAIRTGRAALDEQKARVAAEKKAFSKELQREIEQQNADMFQPGVEAIWKAQNSDVTILSKVDNDGCVEVQAGSIRLKLGIENLAIKLQKKKKQRTNISFDSRKPVMRELDLRGKRADEAISEADRFLSEAMMYAWDEVRLVHGKGTGALRKAIGEFLQSHPCVKDFGPAALGQGDVGVTCVRFR